MFSSLLKCFYAALYILICADHGTDIQILDILSRLACLVLEKLLITIIAIC